MGVSPMKKKYSSPRLYTTAIVEDAILTTPSMQVFDSSNKISNTNDIGFTKEEKASWSDIWNN